MFMNPQIMPVIRRDQAREILLIIASLAKQKIKPPIPEPAALIPSDRLRFFINPLRGG